MYVEPSTDVYILQNCPLDSSYEHTVVFESKEAQANYFLSLAKFHPTAGDEHRRATYQRVNLNALKIELPVEKLYNCNYMMFKNEYFENKWFYAFITSVEYVNNRTSLINYYIDVMQSWFFEAELKECFVEREHVEDDRIGANTVPESLDIGDSVLYHYMDKVEGFSWDPGGKDIGDYYIEIVTVFDSEGNQNAEKAGLYGGVYSGLNYIYFQTVESATAYLNGVVRNHGEDGVIGIYMIPKCITTQQGSKKLQHRIRTVDVSYASTWKYIWGDKVESPRNNKLYTYPFTTIICNNMVGGIADYRVEDLCWEATDGHNDDGDIVWVDKEKYLDTKKEKFYYTIEGISGAPPKCLMMPTHYGGQENARNQQLTIDSFPQCAFVTDSYRAWVAMNYRSMNAAALASGINAIGGTITSAARGHLVSGALTNALGVGTTIGEQLAERAKAKILPNKEHGMTAPDLAMANDSLGFRFYCAHVRPEIAKRIDDYFDRYGYQVNINKIPNRTARKHWSYVKTADCVVVGDLPDDDKQKIITIYNRGITFWSKPEEVGDYSLDNRLDEDKRVAHLEPEWAVDPEFDPDADYDPNHPEAGSFVENTITQEEVAHNAVVVYRFLRSRGWTNGAAIGAIANMDYFSDIDPAFNEQGRFGLCQWHGDEKTSLLSFLSNGGFKQTSGGGQCLFLHSATDANNIWRPTESYNNLTFSTYKNPPAYGTSRDCAVAFYYCYMHGGTASKAEEIQNLATKWEDYLKENNYYIEDSTGNPEYVEPTTPETGTGGSSINKNVPNPKFLTYNGTDVPESIKKNNAKAIYDILKAVGWADNPIFAVLGNWDVESQLDPTAYNEREDAIGFGQWRGSRKDNLRAYLTKYSYVTRFDPLWEVLVNLQPSSVGKGMVMYLDEKGASKDEWAKTSRYNVTFSKFKTNTTASLKHLTYVFDYNYERSDHTTLSERYRAALKWATYLTPIGGGSGGGGR